MARSKIEWLARPGTIPESWNPIGGCSPVSEGCRNCYAARMARRLQRHQRYASTTDKNGWTGQINLDWEELERPYRWRKPRTVFVCSMSDLFHHAVSFDFQRKLLDIISCVSLRQHTFLILTKRADYMDGVIHWWSRCTGMERRLPPNVWLGVTAENQRRADERIPALLEVPAAVHFVSMEPLLEPIDLGEHLPGWDVSSEFDLIEWDGLSWVIAGGETGPGARLMQPDWARAILAQCREHSVPFFLKQMSNRAPIPDDLLVREWPETEEADSGEYERR
jgi:protein gp37